ncbi:MAG: TrkH family potassium uptake protein [Oscillospiraceae bacterium]|jgi:trk system potassium uptake protein TrkH|nr:TrkH family potassium uptake protein [Oscillospiraceae bacterium]
MMKILKNLYSFIKDLRYTTKIILLLGVIILVPIVMVIPFPEDAKYIPAFLYTALIAVAVALLQTLVRIIAQKSGRQSRTKSRQHDIIAVVAIWLFSFLLGSLPFIFGGQLDFLDALFESVSGWTTTGFTMVTTPETMPHIFLFYRGFMQFCGGIGFVLLMLLFASGHDAMKFFSAEGHPDMLKANLIGSARTMMQLYAGFTLFGTLLYILFGMNWFDAINHSMSALGTGGFSTRTLSIGYYQSIPIEIISMFLMLSGATNFSILAILLKGDFRKLFRIGELRFVSVLMIIAIVFIALLGFGAVYSSLGESFRVTIFTAISAITTTGYSISDVAVWTPPMHIILIMIMLIGGGTGSTAGGIKYSRAYILCRSFTENLRAKFKPERAVSTFNIYKPQGKLEITQSEMLSIHHFTLIFMSSFFVGVLILTLGGMEIEEAMFEFASGIGTTGLSLGLTNADSSVLTKCVQIVGMLLARLEVYVVYIFVAAGVNSLHKKISDFRDR